MKEDPSTAAATPKKRKTKVGSSAPIPPPTKKRKVKKSVCRTFSPTPSESEHSQSHIQSDVRIEVDDSVQNEDTAATSNPKVLQPFSTNPEVQFSIPVSVPITDDFFEDVSIPSSIVTI